MDTFSYKESPFKSTDFVVTVDIMRGGKKYGCIMKFENLSSSERKEIWDNVLKDAWEKVVGPESMEKVDYNTGSKNLD